MCPILSMIEVCLIKLTEHVSYLKYVSLSLHNMCPILSMIQVFLKNLQTVCPILSMIQVCLTKLKEHVSYLKYDKSMSH
jgi:hypothetical protein